jgi:hypothetical protein
VLEIIANACQDGQEWTQLISEAGITGPGAANIFMRVELRIQRALTRVKFIADVKRAASQGQDFLTEREHQRGLETHRAANTAYSPTVEYDPDSPEPKGSPKGRPGPTARVHYAPKIPDYDPVKHLSSGADTFQVFGKALSSWIEGYEPQLAEAIDAILNRTGHDTLEGIIDALTKPARALDTQLGAHLFSTAHADV